MRPSSKPAFGSPNVEIRTDVELEPTQEGRRWLCLECEILLATEDHLVPVNGNLEHVFPNPLGQMRQFLTFRELWAVVIQGEPTSDMTWFDAYAWSLALCGSCGQHVGWKWEGPPDPRQFYGLLLDKVRVVGG